MLCAGHYGQSDRNTQGTLNLKMKKNKENVIIYSKR